MWHYARSLHEPYCGAEGKLATTGDVDRVDCRDCKAALYDDIARDAGVTRHKQGDN